MFTGKFKDEGAGKPFTDGVFLRSKMYSITNEDPQLNKKTGKGISRRALHKETNHAAYVACLEDDYVVKRIKMTNIRSENHVVHTVKQFKKGLSPFNDKLYISKDSNGSFITHSFGYKDE